MEERWWEGPMRILADFWWAILIVFVLVISAFFTRSYWLPLVGVETNLPPTIVPTVVLPTRQPSRVPAPTITAVVPTVTRAAPTQAAPTATVAPTAKAELGSPAPAFALKTLSGKNVSLADYRGKPVMIMVFASWCPYCKEEAPGLAAVYKKYKDQGLVVLVVDTMYNDNKDDLKKFLTTNNWTFDPLLDESGDFGEMFGFTGVPGNIFIDRDGVIRNLINGSINQTKLESEVKKIL